MKGLCPSCSFHVPPPGPGEEMGSARPWRANTTLVTPESEALPRKEVCVPQECVCVYSCVYSLAYHRKGLHTQAGKLGSSTLQTLQKGSN